MKWWGWIGIAIAFGPVSNSAGYLVGFVDALSTNTDGSVDIGKGIQMFAMMIPRVVGRLAAALMIWIAARE